MELAIERHERVLVTAFCRKYQCRVHHEIAPDSEGGAGQERIDEYPRYGTLKLKRAPEVATPTLGHRRLGSVLKASR